jgi:hypothetical protein
MPGLRWPWLDDLLGRDSSAVRHPGPGDRDARTRGQATGSIPPSLGLWRYGMHPRATELRIRSLERVFLPLGEALRLEMTDDDPDMDHTVHLQYYVVTDLGPWALWLSCARADMAECEAPLRELTLTSLEG